MTPERLIAMMAPKSPRLDGPGGGGAPEWTAQDAAHAAAGLSQPAWYAFAFRWAYDHTVLPKLRRELMRAAWAIARREHWPEEWNGGPYLSGLVDLALLEERLPVKDLAPQVTGFSLYAHLMGWPDHAWTPDVSRRYGAIREVIDQWCHDAHRHIGRRIRDGGT